MSVRYQPLIVQFYQKNRKKLFEKLAPNSLVLVHSNDLMPRNGDCYFSFRQNSDLLYLCGIDQAESILLLNPDVTSEKREILFIKKTNEHIKIWEGEKYSKEQARALSGIENVQWIENFDAVFQQMLVGKKNLYFNNNANERAALEVPTRTARFLEKLEGLLNGKKLIPLGNFMSDMRVIKEKEEILVLKNAIQITAKAFDRVLKFVSPDQWEYEIEAEITHEFIKNSANTHAYQPIIASGVNSCVLHYIDNNQRCKKGDLLLLDFGAEYANYAADLSRTIPVSGKFSKRQRAVYDAVLEVFYSAKSQMIVGNTFKNLNESVAKEMEKQLVNLGLLNAQDVKKQSATEPAYKRYFMHGVAHFLGMDVHDIGNRNTPFKAGMVLTCEPGIYISEEKIGIRLENDILITEKGPIDLMADIPLEAEKIEQIMKG